ncbi:MAG: hypothetical protein ACREHD_26720 [Pirellulales bacterium]
MLTGVVTLPANLVKSPKPKKPWLQFRLRSLLLFATALCVPFWWMGREMELRRKERAADTRRQIIRSEINSLASHEWAGEYYYGDGLGVNISLVLAPRSGYSFEWRGCGGLYDRNYGPLDQKKGRLRLSFTLPHNPNGLAGITEEIIPVAWGTREYLIPPGEMVRFCNDVNRGAEPRTGPHGFHLLRRGDEKKPVSGLPSLPDEFKRYLLTTPIEAEIVQVGGPASSGTAIVLNRGTKHGFFPGMELHVIEPSDHLSSVKITAVEEDRSKAVVERIFDDEPEPGLGWKLSTRSP